VTWIAPDLERSEHYPERRNESEQELLRDWLDWLDWHRAPCCANARAWTPPSWPRARCSWWRAWLSGDAGELCGDDQLIPQRVGHPIPHPWSFAVDDLVLAVDDLAGTSCRQRAAVRGLAAEYGIG